MSILEKDYIITMSNGERWSLPVIFIALDRAGYYKEKDGLTDIKESLSKDTIPLFEADEFEIEDWAKNNMDWEDVRNNAYVIEKNLVSFDYQQGWGEGEVEIV